MGVDGPGLTCRLLDEANLFDSSGLPRPPGWRESKTYDGWDVKQFVTDQNLCDIGNGWQRCEAKGTFGQFRPVGFDLHAGEGTPMRVTASALILRFVPTSSGNEPIATIPARHACSRAGRFSAGVGSCEGCVERRDIHRPRSRVLPGAGHRHSAELRRHSQRSPSFRPCISVKTIRMPSAAVSAAWLRRLGKSGEPSRSAGRRGGTSCRAHRHRRLATGQPKRSLCAERR